MCDVMGNFTKRGKVILGTNLKEAGHILSAVGENENIAETHESMVDCAEPADGAGKWANNGRFWREEDLCF
jgi:hypothetical protein